MTSNAKPLKELPEHLLQENKKYLKDWWLKFYCFFHVKDFTRYTFADWPHF